MNHIDNITKEITAWLWKISNLNYFDNHSYNIFDHSHFKKVYSEVVGRIVRRMYQDGDTTDMIKEKFISRLPALIDETGEKSYSVMMYLLASINDCTKIKRVVTPKESRRFYDLKKNIIISLINTPYRRLVDAWMEEDEEGRSYYTLVFKDYSGDVSWTFHQPERNLRNLRFNLNCILRGIKTNKSYHRENQTDVNIYDRPDFTLDEYIDCVDTLFVIYHFWLNKNY